MKTLLIIIALSLSSLAYAEKCKKLVTSPVEGACMFEVADVPGSCPEGWVSASVTCEEVLKEASKNEEKKIKRE